jgi:type I restriction enzyme R subunit
MVGGDSNFAALRKLEPQVYRLGLLAERYFVEDPNTCQIKLRQLSELTAQLTASRFGLVIDPADNFADVLRRLKFECSLPREVGELFHSLRIAGNHAAHGATDDHASALTGLKLARQLAIWYSRTFYEVLSH